MKKFLLLIPALAGGLLLTGCETTVVTAGPGPGPAYYGDDYGGDPYYVYGGVNYYYVDGRYFYFRDHRRFYVGGLPGGGSYWHGRGGNGGGRGNFRGNNIHNTTVVHTNNVHTNNVHVQNKVAPHGGGKGPFIKKGKKQP